MLVRKKAFERIGGFSEDYGLPFEDWQFHIRAAIQGLKQESLIWALFWKRTHADSFQTSRSMLGALNYDYPKKFNGYR